MDFGIVTLSIVPVRAEPFDRSEMVTQLLYGELVAIEQQKEGWYAIRNVYDNYEGWVDAKQVQPINEAEFHRLNKFDPCFVNDLVEVVQDIETLEAIPVVMGSMIRNLENNEFVVDGKRYEYTGQVRCAGDEVSVREIIEHAMMFLNAPYLWGGKSSFGIDCSGFVQLVFMLSGIYLLRDASQQAGLGEHVSFLDEARPGDLLFFDNPEGEIVHVGIFLQDGEIIHASGKVRIDNIDHQGIYNEGLKRHTHKLRLIRRIL